MQLQVRGKSYRIPWEYIIAPFLIFLAAVILVLSNLSSIKSVYIDYSSETISAPQPDINISPVPSGTPMKTEQTPSYTEKPSEDISKKQSNKVNINNAGMDELMVLPYIGEVKAKAIISYRKEHGPFKKIEELENIKGIGPKTLEKLKPLVTLK